MHRKGSENQRHEPCAIAATAAIAAFILLARSWRAEDSDDTRRHKVKNWHLQDQWQSWGAVAVLTQSAHVTQLMWFRCISLVHWCIVFMGTLLLWRIQGSKGRRHQRRAMLSVGSWSMSSRWLDLGDAEWRDLTGHFPLQNFEPKESHVRICKNLVSSESSTTKRICWPGHCQPDPTWSNLSGFPAVKPLLHFWTLSAVDRGQIGWPVHSMPWEVNSSFEMGWMWLDVTGSWPGVSSSGWTKLYLLYWFSST